MHTGETAEVKNVECVSKKTSPPPKYTVDSIITLMQKYGIGTSATMAEIVKKLQNPKRQSIVLENGVYSSTAFGRKFISVVPDELKSPELTKNIEEKKKGKRQGADIQFASNQEYREFIERVATQNGVNISNLNAIQRFADDETDPAYILRFTLITPIITTYGNPYLIIRKFPKNFPEIQDLVRENFMPQKLADSLVERFRIGSTLICGGNSDGKSTLLNALKETLPEDMAVMVAQQADELTTKHHPDMIFLHSLAESAESAVKYDLEQLSIASLTMDVDFFIVGEVKGTEAMYLINAAYTGQISAATVHSLSAQAAPEKIVDYALQATGNKYNRAELLKMIADCYHTVVNVKDYKVYEVLEIVGWDADTQSIKYRSLYHL